MYTAKTIPEAVRLFELAALPHISKIAVRSLAFHLIPQSRGRNPSPPSANIIKTMNVIASTSLILQD